MSEIIGDCCDEHINALNDAREKARNSGSDLYTLDVLHAMAAQEKHWAKVRSANRNEI